MDLIVIQTLSLWEEGSPRDVDPLTVELKLAQTVMRGFKKSPVIIEPKI